MHRPAATSQPRPAFTLIELLIVIGIITILISVAVVVGQKVTSSGKQRVTEGLIKTLDMSLSAYIQARGQSPPEYATDPRDSTHAIPVADGMIGDPPDGASTLINTVGLYLLQCRPVPEADSVLKGLEPRYVRMYDPDAPDSTNPAKRPPLLTVFDGWGRPIRYVHPAFKGVIPASATGPGVTADPRDLAPVPVGKTLGFTQMRRTGNVYPPSIPDADAGFSLNNRPYFYSMGADGKAGYVYDSTTTTYTKTDYNKDNVFTTVPNYVPMP